MQGFSLEIYLFYAVESMIHWLWRTPLEDESLDETGLELFARGRAASGGS